MMNLTKALGLLAVGGLLVVAAPNQSAQAASLINPGIAATVQDGSAGLATEVHYRRHRHYHPRRHWHRHHNWHRPPLALRVARREAGLQRPASMLQQARGNGCTRLH